MYFFQRLSLNCWAFLLWGSTITHYCRALRFASAIGFVVYKTGKILQFVGSSVVLAAFMQTTRLEHTASSQRGPVAETFLTKCYYMYISWINGITSESFVSVELNTASFCRRTNRPGGRSVTWSSLENLSYATVITPTTVPDYCKPMTGHRTFV